MHAPAMKPRPFFFGRLLSPIEPASLWDMEWTGIVASCRQSKFQELRPCRGRRSRPASRSAGLARFLTTHLLTADGLAEVSVTLIITIVSQTQQLKCRVVCLCAL